LGFQWAELIAEEEPKFRGFTAAVFLGAGRLPVPAGPGEGEGEGIRIEGLGEIIDGPQLDGLDGSPDAALGGHDDGSCVAAKGLFTEQVRSQAVGQVHIQQDKIEVELIRQTAGGADRVRDGHVGSQTFQGGGDVATEEGFIVEDEDGETGERRGGHGGRIPVAWLESKWILGGPGLRC
jgi:hypothetical protein